MTTFLLVPSPLLGAASWRPVADELRRQGRAAVVVDLAGVRTPDDVVAAAEAAGRGHDDVVVVPHSNAGYHAPLVASLLGARGCVHVDAALPDPADRSTRLAPPRMLGRLRALADGDGTLPVWSEWWTSEELAEVLPDDATWAPVAVAQPRLPLDYFTAGVAVPAGWADQPQAYLAFGDTYAEELALARTLRWPVEQLDGAHLHLLRDPGEVVASVVALAGRLRA